ncbi:MAG: hypothetical protein WCP96_17105 [Methylococcaceae bacterium]
MILGFPKADSRDVLQRTLTAIHRRYLWLLFFKAVGFSLKNQFSPNRSRTFSKTSETNPDGCVANIIKAQSNMISGYSYPDITINYLLAGMLSSES